MRLPADDTKVDGPDLTPVIDVVFLLLIFFLVATRYDQEERELDINLPEVAEAQPLAMTQELIVNVARDGTYRIVRDSYSAEQLSSLLAEAQRNNPHQRVLIRADGESALKHALRVMGLCNRVGLDYQIAALEEK